MTTPRIKYTYELIGQIQSLKKRTNPKYSQYFYQLNVLCKTNPLIQKIFVFQNKLIKPQIWETLQSSLLLTTKKYLFYCRNYRGSYYLVDWVNFGESK